MDIKNAIGVVLLPVGLAALLYRVLKAGLRLAPAASLVNESLHDLSFVSLGLALLLRGTPAKDLLVAGFVLLLAAYLTRRYLLRAGDPGSGRPPGAADRVEWKEEGGGARQPASGFRSSER